MCQPSVITVAEYIIKSDWKEEILYSGSHYRGLQGLSPHLAQLFIGPRRGRNIMEKGRIKKWCSLDESLGADREGPEKNTSPQDSPTVAFFCK